MDKERLKFVLQEAEELKEPHLFQRDLIIPLGSGKIVVLVGIRRSGKTFLLHDIQQRLIAGGVDRRQIIRLSFEDDRLHPIKPEEFDLSQIPGHLLYGKRQIAKLRLEQP